MVTEELKKNVLSLAPLDKIQLVEDILNTLNVPDPEIEQKWIEESERRYEQYKKGLVKGATLEEFES